MSVCAFRGFHTTLRTAANGSPRHARAARGQQVPARRLCARPEETRRVAASRTASSFMAADDPETGRILSRDMAVYPEFISAQEEESILKEIDPYMQRLRYEHDHWDDAIHGYRETERSRWSAENEKIIRRLKETAFPASLAQLTHIHVLDLSQTGVIKPHVDSVRYCGSIIAGVCLLSDAVMRLASVVDNRKMADFWLPRRCLYVMREKARYEYTHEVLSADKSVFNGKPIARTRRVSIIVRAQPDSQHDEAGSSASTAG